MLILKLRKRFVKNFEIDINLSVSFGPKFQSASTQKHNKLIESINKTVNDQRKQELEDKLEKKRQEEEAKRLMKIEKRSEMISPV